MLQLLADRFVCDRGRWFDLATARPVLIHLDSPGRQHDQFEWSDRCAALSRLRHPLLHPLIDYGYASANATFEAYAILPPLRAGAVAGSCAATHAVRFLHAHAIRLNRQLADTIVRPVQPGGRAGRPLGVVLQHRRILDLLADLLDAGGAGPVTVAVAGPARSGVSTVRDAFARIVRLAGYVPVSVESARRWPQLQRLTAGRHVCVMSGEDAGHDPGTRALWLARLGLESTRRHVHLMFVRASDTPGGALQLDPLGVAAMTSMVYVDPDFGPAPGELFDAARVADGWPGRFLAALHAAPFEAIRQSSVPTVHEAHAPYEVTDQAPLVSSASAKPMRLASALARAEGRAVALAAAGRHGAATRLLRRAGRLLEARGAYVDAAACAVQLAWIARSRGDSAAAEEQVQRARSVTQDPAIHISASIAAGVLWTDNGRGVEAEAALRAAVVAAKALGHRRLERRASLGLARTLLWQHRAGDALGSLEGLGGADFPDIACEALALASRIHSAAGEVASSLGVASQAIQRAGELHDARLEAAAHRAMAIGLLLAGDVPGAASHVSNGLRAAAAAHLPLTTIRLRALLLQTLRAGGPSDPKAAALRASLLKVLNHHGVPAVVRKQIDAACNPAATGSGSCRPPMRRHDRGEAVAQLIEAAQRAPDDTAALSCVLNVLAERLDACSLLLLAGQDGSRVLASCGRPWRERPAAARRALETGLPTPLERDRQPPEAGEPVKYAGNTIAAIACRWPAGSSVDATAAALHLGAGAVAASTYAQALLDAREPPAPVAVGDLLGDSPAAVSLREAIQRAARAPFPVLVEGESGSGKELVARAIHRLGPRRERRFCAINCAAITDELVEAELFGHARGAFTGAATERAGLFEEADGGSLFLDEVGELSARAQAKLLRVLQDGEVRRVGENFPRRVDVRLIAATNRRLEHEVAAARFRADLRFRLDVVRITVPALRDRVADIPILAAHFWTDASSRVGSRATLGPETLAALARYDWPGNVRELQNAMASIAVHAPRRGRIGTAMLPSRLAASAPVSAGSFETARTDFERRFVRAALAQTGGHRARTAQVLGVSRQGLAKIMRRLGIE
jgi:DNA-binding NtrC family response regulator